MADFLPVLATLTLGGGAAVLVFALATRVIRTRYGARWRCWVWLLLCLRLVATVSFDFAAENPREAPIQINTPTDRVIFSYDVPATDPIPTQGVPVVPEQTPQLPQQPSSSDSSNEKPEQDVEDKEPVKEIDITLLDVLFYLWLAGIAVMAVWVVFSHLRFLRFVRRWSRPVQDADTAALYGRLCKQLRLKRRPDLRFCAGLKAPMLAGLFRTVLLLPEDAPQGDELRFSLLHELTHYKRRDIWLKSLALLANVIHWFNPCMWYMVRLVERDTELACDEAALHRLPAEDHAAYGRTILNAVERLKLK